MTKAQFSLVLILAAGAIFYFLLLGQWASLKEARADHAAASSAIEELKMLAAKRDELTETYNTIKGSLLEKVGMIIPTGPQTSVFLADLELMASRAGVSLKSVDFSQSVAPAGGAPASVLNVQQGAEVLPVSLRVSGTYEGFRRFLQDIELNQRLIDVTVVNFGAPLGNLFEFSVQAKIYHQ